MIDPKQWMKRLPDDTTLGSLSIPGTHNSGACYRTLPTVRCQNKSVSLQLLNGVRFLDVRVGKCPLTPSDKRYELAVVHGKFPVRIPVTRKFRKLLRELYEFLADYPSECILLSLKVEGVGEWEGDEFPELLWSDYISKNVAMWHVGTDLPQLEDARGKIVLLRRFDVQDSDLKSRLGFDITGWSYNTTGEDLGTFAVQDNNEILSKQEINEKVNYVKKMAEEAVSYNSTGRGNKLFLNFTSGTNFLNKDCWPEKIAKTISETDLANYFKKGCGIIILDFIDLKGWKFAKVLYESNFDPNEK